MGRWEGGKQSRGCGCASSWSVKLLFFLPQPNTLLGCQEEREDGGEERRDGSIKAQKGERIQKVRKRGGSAGDRQCEPVRSASGKPLAPSANGKPGRRERAFASAATSGRFAVADGILQVEYALSRSQSQVDASIPDGTVQARRTSLDLSGRVAFAFAFGGQGNGDGDGV